LLRERRKKSGATQVALVGYTNAGKSTLLNRMASAEVFAENLLFATLDPTSRAMELPNGRQILLTDTVGFIQKLPTTLIDSFKATLEEIAEADLILTIVEASHPNRLEHLEVIKGLFKQLGLENYPSLLVFNKIDLLNEEELNSLKKSFPMAEFVSAYQKSYLDILTKQIIEKLADNV